MPYIIQDKTDAEPCFFEEHIELGPFGRSPHWVTNPKTAMRFNNKANAETFAHYLGRPTIIVEVE